ncbi:hypothetical protein FQA39_LY03090 [Lamprigera yunnana]|nr:hypothetical protein FQA39_LY03090 [Lamprigera yunnana]
MTSETELKREAIQKLYNDHGMDLLDLKKCIELKSKYDSNIREIEQKLDLNNAESQLAKTILDANNVLSHLDDMEKGARSTVTEVEQYVAEVDDFREKVNNYVSEVIVLENVQQYLKVLRTVEAHCNYLEKHIQNKDDEQSTTVFANLTEIARILVNTPTTNLRSFLQESVNYWYNILKTKLSEELGAALTSLKWPFVNLNASEKITNEATINKLQKVIEYLLQIDLPEELVTAPQGLFAGYPRLSLPVVLLIEPLRKRFLYHFYGSRKTNRIDKPEWYFTKILTWIKDHSDFIDKWIQPVVDELGLYYIEVKVQFMRGLVELAVDKLYSELPNLENNEFLFSHCIDEALGFDKELKTNYRYPSNQPSILLVITQAPVFVKWLTMEKKFALEKMDMMLSDSGTMNVFPQDVENHEFKIIPSGEIFITLLQTITERYESLLQPGHRLQFFDLQLELLDDFRVRLLQIVNAENEHHSRTALIAVIANTAFYIENVLVDWGQMLHFLNLYYYKSQAIISDERKFASTKIDFITDIDTDTVFNEILSLYRHMKKDLLFGLVEMTVDKVKHCSKSYLQENWSNMEKMSDMRSHSLTPTACPLFEALATKLHELQKYLTPRLFTLVWRLVAVQIDAFLFEKLVYANRFNEGGGHQLKFDITRNLLPLFAQFTDKPDSYCPYLNDASILLTISKGSAMLLRDTLITLEGATGVEDRRGQALKDVGINVLNPSEALIVLLQRIDLKLHQIPSFD